MACCLPLISFKEEELARLDSLLSGIPAICIVHEWAANEDPEFREIFYRQLLPERKASGKLLFVISHDVRYYSIADHVLVIDSGEISERTTKP